LTPASEPNDPLGNALPRAASYTVTNLQAFNDAAHEGTQIQANVLYDDGLCVGTYTALGTWPFVTCTQQADCNPIGCGAQTDGCSPSSQYAFGTGIGQDYPTVCAFPEASGYQSNNRYWLDGVTPNPTYNGSLTGVTGVCVVLPPVSGNTATQGTLPIITDAGWNPNNSFIPASNQGQP
jgi:hypothetical protein